MDTSIHGHTATQVPPRSIPKSNQKSYCPLFSPYPDIFALLGFPRACPGWTRCPGSSRSIAVTPAAPALVFPSHSATINPFSMPELKQGWHQPQVRKAKPKANTKLKKKKQPTASCGLCTSPGSRAAEGKESPPGMLPSWFSFKAKLNLQVSEWGLCGPR